MLSLLTKHKWIYFPNLVPFKDLLPLMWVKPKKGNITTYTQLINSSFKQLRYLDVYTKG
jgi:hypothetical protein